MSTQFIDRCLLGTALVFAVASSAWFSGGARLMERHHHRNHVKIGGPVARYQPVASDSSSSKTREWLPPAVQTRGEGWVYEVFTPPEVHYDARSRQFAVFAPEAGNETLRAPELVLVGVQRQPFPLQLVGYLGGEGNFLGTFENLHTAEVFLGGSGRQVPGLNLVISDFDVQRRPLPLSPGLAGNHWVATAVVRDLHTGESTTLNSLERAYTDELRAVLAEDPDESESYAEFRRGELIESADRTYRVDRLQAEPPLADLVEIAAGPLPSRRWTLSASADVSTTVPEAGEALAQHDD